ncbi:uncharacterized protein C8Q71DRAFT_311374 [Rhodofomes roseus]|uniref:F-box domain-containing protein n=1 Tax=Rhodofomes roseus TaxID=34475 RepID=A0ABQ8K337_9APHY|nr:uncharacterized protein C8Q71DRAFT_311374 [Rhodofomes roseus]KAH9831245.1 hypothetical protein C8Q71DRAFT_311374 [Rhodofomes roseus]
MAPSLPPELTDHIIDYLHDDSCALAACALTCRQWLPAARYHSFGAVTLVPHRCETFAELIAVSPELALAVRSVKLRSLANGSRVWHRADLSFLTALTAATDFFLDTMRVGDTVHEAFVQGLSAVRRLTAHNCWFATLYDFAALVSSFQCLEFLSMSILIDDPDARGPPLPSLPDRLQVIELGDLEWDRMPAAALFEWIKDVPNPQQLVGMSCHVIWEVWPTQAILAICGSHLQHFELVIKTEGSLDRILGKAGFSLSECTSLQTFTLRLWLAEMCVPENQDLLWIPRLFSQLHAPHLHQITLSLHVDDMMDLRTLASENAVRQLTEANHADLTALDWASMHTTLAREDLSSLRKFVIEGRGPTDALEAYIEHEYPELHQRAVIVLA